ncbi:MAG: hypothetical protein KKC18_13030, partial [Chloroflexi bacterium]|nr:hypothetical protein [Chloroflexota bacterium]
RFVGFTTPEEASRQLGRVIVGAPAPGGEPYDLDATFTLFREGRPERRAVQIKGATESHILDTPFAFDGQVRAARWEAEVEIAWRGERLTYTYRSKPLFPTIYAWRALVYNREEEPIPLEQVMDGAGRVNPELGWRAYVQTAADSMNVNQPHAVLFYRECRQELQTGVPLAGYLATTIVSPDEREAVVRFRAAGPVAFYLNGQPVEALTVEEEEGVHPFFRRLRETAVMHMHAGENTLVVDTQPMLDQAIWLFGGAFLTPNGDLMTDLAFK